jgi:hypothetical protein
LPRRGGRSARRARQKQDHQTHTPARQLTEQARDLHAVCIIIEAAADVFAGDAIAARSGTSREDGLITLERRWRASIVRIISPAWLEWLERQ